MSRTATPTELTSWTIVQCVCCVMAVAFWCFLLLVCTVFLSHSHRVASGSSIHPPCVSLFCSKSRTFLHRGRAAARNERLKAKGPQQSPLLPSLLSPLLHRLLTIPPTTLSSDVNVSHALLFDLACVFLCKLK